MGYYCVDNLPVELIPIFAELHAAGEGDFARAALLVDAREGQQLEKLPGLLRHLPTSLAEKIRAENARSWYRLPAVDQYHSASAKRRTHP